jgi:Ca-activated chloride channel family protein
MEKYKVANEND